MSGNYYSARVPSKNRRILLVEDDPNFGTVLEDYLVMSGFDVVLVKNGMEGFERSKKETFDMCILDAMMPYKNGFILAKEIRKRNGKIPTIFLTVRAMHEDVVKGYRSGGDDYLNKPFDSEILLMKVRSMLQRKAIETVIDDNELKFKISNFFLNTKLRVLRYKDEGPVKLSPKENELLRLLALHTNDFMSRELALSKIWKNDNYLTLRSMDVYIAKLRRLPKRDDKVEILDIHDEGFRLIANKETESFVRSFLGEYFGVLEESINFAASKVKRCKFVCF